MFREYKTRGTKVQNPGLFFAKPGSSKFKTRVAQIQDRAAQIERPAELIQSIEMNVTE